MTKRIRVVAVATHPIQYYTPWFRGVAAEPTVELKVVYLRSLDAEQQGQGFGVPFKWDVDLLGGYDNVTLPAGLVLPQLWRALRAAKPDVVLLTGWQETALVAAALMARALGVRTVVRGEANALRRRPWPTQVAHRVLLRLYDRYIAIGASSREFYLGYGIDSARVHDARYFVENERFEKQAAERRPQRAQWRAHWRCPEQAMCFLFAGKLIPKKEPATFLLALERLAAEGRAVHGLVVGDGVLRASLEKFCAERKLPVTFAGFLNQTEIARAYTAADALVLPSDYGETWGLVVNEAMLFGVPAIVSDRVGCGPDLVEPNVTGLRFGFGDCDGLTECMKVMADDRSGVMRMGEAARQRVHDGYSLRQAVAGTVAALHAAAER
jgi:glycosyltransferase involved in cell wall biosynthesis